MVDMVQRSIEESLIFVRGVKNLPSFMNLGEGSSLLCKARARLCSWSMWFKGDTK